MRLKLYTLFLFISFTATSYAQKNNLNIERWNKFTLTFLDASPDPIKRMALDTFRNEFVDWLEEENAFQHKHESLKNVSRIESPEGDWRIFTFHVVFSDGHYENFGYTQHYDKIHKSIQVTELKDNKPDYKVVETKNYTKTDWYGATYYSIVPKSIGKKGQYVLIGTDNNNKITKRKVIEVISFTRFGEPVFGAPIFKTEKRMFNRIVLEYNAKASVTIRYQKENNWIVFDYIAPTNPAYKDKFEYYGPSGEYDAFVIERNILKISRGSDARNTTENKGNTSKKPERKLGPR